MTGLLMWLVLFESLSINSKLTRFPHLKPVSSATTTRRNLRNLLIVLQCIGHHVIII